MNPSHAGESAALPPATFGRRWLRQRRSSRLGS